MVQGTRPDYDPSMLDQPLTGAATWTAETLGPEDGHLTLSPDARTEIINLAKTLRVNPLPTLCLSPDDFDLPACRALMAEAEHCLTAGPGFVLIDRLPLDDINRIDAVSVYWVLANLIARPVAQKWDGTMLYEVTDSSGLLPGNSVRPDTTNAEQVFHTDNAYNVCPPDFVSLLCMRTAKEGGISRIVSLNSAHNLMRERHPDLLPRLYAPFLWDRVREHGDQDVPTLSNSLFSTNGDELTTRLGNRLIRQGYSVAKTDIDEEGDAALEALYDILNDPALFKEFYLEPGQMQIIDNRFIGHKRTAYEDWSEPNQKRQLVRLWLRDGGKPFYHG